MPIKLKDDEQEEMTINDKPKIATKAKILLLVAIIVISILGGLAYYLRNYIMPINAAISTSLAINKKIDTLPTYINQADFKQAKSQIVIINQDIDQILTSLDAISNSSSQIDKSAILIKENISITQNYLSNLNEYLGLLSNISIRIKLYDNYLLVEKPFQNQDTLYVLSQENLDLVESKLKLNKLAMNESCSVENKYIKKIDFCSKLQTTDQIMNNLLARSKLNNHYNLALIK